MTAPDTDPTTATEPTGTDYHIATEPVTAEPRTRTLPGSRARNAAKNSGDTPPKSRRTRKSREDAGDGPAKKATADAPEYVPGKIGNALKGVYGQIGMMWGMFDPTCAQVLMQNAETMANSMEKWAKDSPQVRAFLDKVITTSVVGEVITAHMPIVMAIGMHHVPALRNKLGGPAGQQAGSPMPGHANGADQGNPGGMAA